MNKGGRKYGWAVALILVAGLGGWIGSRWDAWFHNPEEPPYSVPLAPSRLLLTFGNHGELSRYVSWVSGESIDETARLLLTCGDDTLSLQAQGEVFESRSGKCAFYRVELTELRPNQSYSYAVVSHGLCSSWYRFCTTDPQDERFSFLFVGDVQDSIGGVANQLLKRAVEQHPEIEFAAFGGDLIERPMDKYFVEAFCSIDSICTAMPVINITGNHDYLKYLVRKCERRFALTFPYFLKGMEERDDENHLFHFAYHNTDFYMLDSDRGALFLYQQASWLKEEIARSAEKHRIALVHHPLFSVRKKSNNLVERWMFNDIVADNDFDLVLQGHEHGYTHCTQEETPLTGNVCSNPPLYTVSHCSPKNYNLHPTERFYPVLSDSRYYQVVRVEGEIVTMLAYDANTGARVDSIRIVKK